MSVRDNSLQSTSPLSFIYNHQHKFRASDCHRHLALTKGTLFVSTSNPVNRDYRLYRHELSREITKFCVTASKNNFMQDILNFEVI